jgi:hypothetical protein
MFPLLSAHDAPLQMSGLSMKRRFRSLNVLHVLLVLLLHATSSAAQPAPAEPRKWQFGLSFAAGVATGEFAEHVDSAPGVLFFVDRQIHGSVFSVGGELVYLLYGSQDWTSTVVGAPNLKVKLTTSNNALMGLGHLRAARRSGNWRPYVDGELGAQGLWTETSIDLGASDCRVLCPDVSATDLEDTVFAYGFGAGLTWRPSEGGVFGLDVGARYSSGGEAKYLTEGAIIRNPDGQPTVNVSRSRTDMLLFYVGVTVGR